MIASTAFAGVGLLETLAGGVLLGILGPAMQEATKRRVNNASRILNPVNRCDNGHFRGFYALSYGVLTNSPSTLTHLLTHLLTHDLLTHEMLTCPVLMSCSLNGLLTGTNELFVTKE